jgi:hypothetical protein
MANTESKDRIYDELAAIRKDLDYIKEHMETLIAS